MNYFEDWYSQPNDENEEQERLLTSMLESAAADIPTGGMQNDPQVNSTFTSDPAEFINRIVADNHIPHLTNRYPADINLGLGDQEDLPTKSVYDFLRKPEEPLDDLGFFDRNVSANLFPNMAGSTGPDRDFWERQLVNRNFADMNSWFEDRRDLPTRDQSEYDFLRKPEEPLGDLGFFDRKAPANLFPSIVGSAEPDDDFWGGLQKGSSLEAQTPSADATREQEEAQNVSGHPAADRNSYNQYEDVLDRTTGAGGIGVAPESYLVYKDGQLSVHDDNDNEYMRIPASTGQPGVTDPTLKGKGPIPPGRYWFDPREISPSGRLRNYIGDWGEYRVRLYPTGDTNTYGRTNFFFHGGEKPGSAGCIDIGNADRHLFPQLMKLRGPIYIKVK
jgi:hypothetical protein